MEQTQTERLDELVAKWNAEGDQDAIREAYEATGALRRTMVARMLPPNARRSHEALEAVDIAFVRAITTWKPNSGARFRTWYQQYLTWALTSLKVEYMKDRLHWMASLDAKPDFEDNGDDFDTLESRLPAPDMEALRLNQETWLARLESLSEKLAVLPLKYKEMLRMRLEGLNYHQIATKMGLKHFKHVDNRLNQVYRRVPQLRRFFNHFGELLPNEIDILLQHVGKDRYSGLDVDEALWQYISERLVVDGEHVFWKRRRDLVDPVAILWLADGHGGKRKQRCIRVRRAVYHHAFPHADLTTCSPSVTCGVPACLRLEHLELRKRGGATAGWQGVNQRKRVARQVQAPMVT